MKKIILLTLFLFFTGCSFAGRDLNTLTFVDTNITYTTQHKIQNKKIFYIKVENNDSIINESNFAFFKVDLKTALFKYNSGTRSNIEDYHHYRLFVKLNPMYIQLNDAYNLDEIKSQNNKSLSFNVFMFAASLGAAVGSNNFGVGETNNHLVIQSAESGLNSLTGIGNKILSKEQQEQEFLLLKEKANEELKKRWYGTKTDFRPIPTYMGQKTNLFHSYMTNAVGKIECELQDSKGNLIKKFNINYNIPFTGSFPLDVAKMIINEIYKNE